MTPRRRWHLSFVLVCAVTAAVLLQRARNRYEWSKWAQGDAQTMMSSEQWTRGGWIANRLMFAPQGYAKALELVDRPELRHHAHGISPHVTPSIGPRRLYNHCPSGYLVPYATIHRAGLTSLFAARALSIVFSIAAVALFYLALCELASPGVALLSASFYFLSHLFQDYAYSMANMPIDDLLRFAFMYATVRTTRGPTAESRRRAFWASCALQFALSLCSFDSVFFVYAWLVGWMVLESGRLSWRRLALHSLLPVVAFGLLLLQNVWYLGARDGWIDYRDTFLFRANASQSFPEHVGEIVAAVWKSFQSLQGPLVTAAAFAIYFGWKRRNPDRPGLPDVRVLGVLFLAGLTFPVVMTGAMWMSYEARQFLPFATTLAAGLVAAAVVEATKRAARWRRIAAGVASVVLLALVVLSSRTSEPRPSFGLGRLERIGRTRTRAEKVLFDLDTLRRTGASSPYVPGFNQVGPVAEYYAGMPVLCFDEPNALVRDLAFLLRHSPRPFSPLVLSSSRDDLAEVLRLLREAGLARSPEGTPHAKSYAGWIVLDLTDVVRVPRAQGTRSSRSNRKRVGSSRAWYNATATTFSPGTSHSGRRTVSTRI